MPVWIGAKRLRGIASELPVRSFILAAAVILPVGTAAPPWAERVEPVAATIETTLESAAAADPAIRI